MNPLKNAFQRPKTPDQVRAEFRARGETFTAWAERHGYRRDDVSRVMAGINKATRGTGHEIAVKLGLKVAEPESLAA